MTARTAVVYAAGAVQGIVLVTMPAASTVFTDPDDYGLSTTQYGAMFLPQVVAAVGAALLGGWLTHRLGTKRVFLAGLSGGLASMLLLIVSQFASRSVAYGLLLLATACLGAGFGLAVPAMNSLTAAFHPSAVDSSILVLNALLGVGTALAPLFVALFVGLGFWWGLPVMSAALLVLILAVGLRLGLDVPLPERSSRARIPARFWPYAVFVLLYGACETVNGNWAQTDMTRGLGASAAVASLALTAFWAMVTVGRVAFAGLSRWVPPRVTYRLLPFLLAVAFVLIAALPDGQPALGVFAFGLAGLGCSALLPLTISQAEEELTSISASVAGGIIAFYQIGYGIAAFGVGPLQARGVSLSTVYAAAALVAVVMGLLSLVVTHRR